MKKIKITKWGTNKLLCIKAVKDLVDLTLQGAIDMVENSEMPCVLEVYDNEKLENFASYIQLYCSDMEYTIEDSVLDIDITKYITMSRTELVENFTNAINNVRAAFSVLINQNDEAGDRYNKVCAEANLLKAEIEKLKANNNKVVEAKNDDLVGNLVAANKSLEETVQKLNGILKAVKRSCIINYKLNSKSIKDGSKNKK